MCSISVRIGSMMRRLTSHRLSSATTTPARIMMTGPSSAVASASACIASERCRAAACSCLTSSLSWALVARSIPATAASPASGSLPAAMKASRPLR